MSHVKLFLDTSVLLTAFGVTRNGGAISHLLTTERAELITFEKCLFESFLAFRGVGGKKPDEGRQDWARRYLKKEGDPIPLGDAIGKLHAGCLPAAHHGVGQAEEALYALPSTFDEYMDEIKRFVRQEDWTRAENEWGNYQKIFENHHRFQALFNEFRGFLSDHEVSVISYEDIYVASEQPWRFMMMEGLSQRSTVPNEDFEIVAAALLSRPNAFVSADKRLLAASASIELNLRWCDFIHLDQAQQYIDAHFERG
ncbi:MAG: hypothetical protein ACPW60_01105 [Methylohalobius sp. ZOD2]